MKIKTVITTILASAVMFTFSGPVFAGEVDILVDKLVEKNILTKSEAEAIVKEMKKEGEKEKQEIKKVAADAVKDKAGISGWVEKTKIKGDVRVRYQKQDTSNDGSVSRDRGRMRVRAGIETKVNDEWSAGIGMASGSDDPRSNNQTFDDVFDTKGWNLDYAYATYSPNEAVSITAGKMNNPFYTTKDLIWDSDINPEGVALEFNKKLSGNVKLFGTAAYYLVEEYGSSKDDPSLLAFQPGIDWKISDKINLKFAGTYYKFNNFEGNDLSVHSAGTNSTDESGNLIYDYDSIVLDAEIGFILDKIIPYIGLFGEYVRSDADMDDTGWLAGIKFGDKKVSEFGDWQFKYNYRKLEKEAWLDFWPDSDFYDGETGVKGSEFEFVMGLSKHVTFGLDYYRSKAIDRDFGENERLLQADLIVKF
ncbi:MAG: putative porin [Deltaproteobacteria bacterium]|nr:putative porin [Deltaproteobacteria bacterium]